MEPTTPSAPEPGQLESGQQPPREWADGRGRTGCVSHTRSREARAVSGSRGRAHPGLGGHDGRCPVAATAQAGKLSKSGGRIWAKNRGDRQRQLQQGGMWDAGRGTRRTLDAGHWTQDAGRSFGGSVGSSEITQTAPVTMNHVDSEHETLTEAQHRTFGGSRRHTFAWCIRGRGGG